MGEVGIKVKVHWQDLEVVKGDPWCWLALGIAVMAFIDVAILSPIKMQGLRMLSLAKIINLLRLKRVIEYSKHLKELKLLLRAIVGSWATLIWAMIVLVGILFVFSIWTTTLIGHNEGYLEMERQTNGWDSEELFGSIGRSMFTLLQVMTRDSWCSGIVRHVAARTWYIVFFFALFLLLTTYGILNLVIAIVVEQALTASQSNEARNKQHQEKQQEADTESLGEIFLLGVAYGDGENLDVQSFEMACKESAEIRWRLRSLGLPMEDVKRLFQVMDGDGSRSLQEKEFVNGCSKIKGPARSKELLALQAQADNMAKKMDTMGFELQETERMLGRLDTATQRMTHRFAPTAQAARVAIRERVRGAAPLVPIPVTKKGSYAEGRLPEGNVPRMPRLPNLTE
jgi:voltage-gated sodium channel